MKPASKHLLSRTVLALVTLLGGIPSAALHAQDGPLAPPPDGRKAQAGNDGVGGIERSGNTPSGKPGTQNGPGSNGQGGPISPAKPAALPGAWQDLGEAAGAGPTMPKLTGSGSGEPGTLVTLTLSNAKPGSVAALFIGVTTVDAPFKGGTLVPAPLLIVPGLPVNAQGMLTLPALLPAAMPSGFSLYTQMWMPDAAAPAGYASTNGLELRIP